MFGYFSGDVIDKEEDNFTILVGGVGYKIFVNESVLQAVEINKKTEIWVSSIGKKEGGIYLYGFNKKEERVFFETLKNISGVGPKTALSLLSLTTPAEIATMIARGDAEQLSTAPKVSKKLAEKIIVELKNTVKNEKVSPEYREVFEALVALGYKKTDARTAAASAKGKNISEKIRDALSNISKI